jgi:hypothetical protein
MSRGCDIIGIMAVALLIACGDDGTGPQVDPPSVMSIEPATGTVGTEIRIDGTGFTSQVTVRFGDFEAPRVLQQGGALFAVAPSGLAVGQTYSIEVLNEGVSPDTAGLTFTAVAPTVRSVNGATRPEGLRGMTLILEGDAFSDSLGLSEAKVYFEGAGGAPIAAPVADTLRDWTDRFVVTEVPQEIPDTTRVWLETPTGTSNAVEFRVIQSGLFSPSNINWTQTEALPEALHALDAAFVAVEDGASPANYVYVAGGMDTDGAPVASVLRAEVEQSGALAGGWGSQSDLPEARAHHRLVAATPLNAPVDTATTGGFLYLLGGLDPDGAASATVWMSELGLDGSTSVWESVTPLPTPMYSTGAAVFGGYLWLVGGAGASGQALGASYRAQIQEDGTLGEWSQTVSLPAGAASAPLVSFGPFLYTVGGDTGTLDPMTATRSGTETSQVLMARIDLRTRDLDSTGWTATESMGKARSKHDAVFAGGAVFVTSGVYNGQPGSSENTFASINADGTLKSWQGATGSETIDVEIGRSLYNQALVAFVDRSGVGHVLVLGGADRDQAGAPSESVLWY